MTPRENALAILRYEPCQKLPVVSFGYWEETLEKWAEEGHVSKAAARSYRRYGDNSKGDREVMAQLGFDFNWNSCIEPDVLLNPPMRTRVLEVRADGIKLVRDSLGIICVVKPGVVSIPSEVGTTLTDRAVWEKLYKPRLQMKAERLPLKKLEKMPPPEKRTAPLGLHLGSLMGNMRNMLGVEQLSYLYMDDEELYIEIINTMCGLCYDCAKAMLDTGFHFDYGHYWEDLCFKNGPLVIPSVFDKLVGPWYMKINTMLATYGIDIVSVDCDGWIDSLMPTWLNNGVNTMFPIEVGTWDASIAPWRQQYGKKVRGVGGMNKNVFAKDRDAIDKEVERLRGLVALGGYIPCPDHRIAPDANYELVKYYCDRMQALA